jgi:hypothetical protein
MLHLFIITHVQTQSNRVCNSYVILLWLMLPRDHFVSRIFYFKRVYIKINCTNKIEKIRIPKESPTRQNWKCCRFGLIEPVHGRYWKVETTVNAPLHRLKQNSKFNTKNGEILNSVTSAEVFIRRLSWNVQCDTVVPFYEKRRMVPN